MQNTELSNLPIDDKLEAYFAPLSEIEKLFVNEYVVSRSKTKAAIKAGLSVHTAGQQGSRLYTRPKVKAALDAIFESEAISTFELIKMTVDAAQANLSECMSSRKVPYTPKVKTPLGKVIDQKQMQVDTYLDYIRTSSPDKKEVKRVKRLIEKINREMALHESELRQNPSAYRIQDGETVLRNEEYLDMKKVINKGLVIEKVEHDKNGKLKVSIVSPTVARQDLIRMAGLYEKDNKQKAAQVIINLLGDDAQLGNVISI